MGLPNEAERRTDYALRVPWVLGLIMTHSIDEKVPGIEELVQRNENHIRTGLLAYSGLEKLRADRGDANARGELERNAGDLGYALLLKKIRPDIEHATEAEIAKAAWGTVPQVALLFWGFRVMVGLGFFFILLFGFAFCLVSTSHFLRARWLLWLQAFALPLPWIAAELGWVVTEVGRQPLAIEGVLPTFLAVSSVSAHNVLVTLFGFIGFYSALLIVDSYLMVKAVRLDPGDIRPDPRVRPVSAPSSAK
jgi:cytochrome d ubiquinol oxidase subunit I